MQKKIKLIYIASNGRSGSTLLDMLIGKHKSCFTLGEFQVLPIEYLNNKHLCGCGKRLDICEFWDNIIRKNKKIITDGSISRFRKFSKGSVLRWKELKDLFFNTSNLKKNINRYGFENYKVLKSLLKKVRVKKNIDFLVDASKDPYRLHWLLKSDFFDIKILHIIKIPEAFVYSMCKKEKNFLKRWFKTIRMSFRWIIQNIIISKVANNHLNKKIRYDELASNPQKKLKEIFEFLNLEYQNISSDGFKLNNHAIAGNLMRFNSGKILLDESWKSKMSKIDKYTVFILTVLFRRLYNS
jgi:hypothetical protein